MMYTEIYVMFNQNLLFLFEILMSYINRK